MTEAFKVPEPSVTTEQAVAWLMMGGAVPQTIVRCVLERDLPAIVKSEVERALADSTLCPQGWVRPDFGVSPATAYLTQRFPETREPHRYDPGCPCDWCEVERQRKELMTSPAPSAPAAPPEPTLYELVKKMARSIEVVPIYTDAERATLHRVEKALPFIEALATALVLGDRIGVTPDGTVVAACPGEILRSAARTFLTENRNG